MPRTCLVALQKSRDIITTDQVDLQARGGGGGGEGGGVFHPSFVLCL